MRKFTIIAILGALIIASGFFAFSYVEKENEDANLHEPYRATLSGEYLCLPHRDTSGPQTLECAMGLKTDDGKYYALDFNLMSEMPNISFGKRITASGTVTPVERLSSDHWRIYPIVGIFTTDSLSNGSSTSEGPVACTMEAFQCPDGTYVGRTGPRCEFSACTQQSSFVGILKQDNAGFKLILNSPGENPLQVSYSMPLIVKVSNVLGQLVDQKVRVYGKFSSGATYEVSRLEALSGTASDATLGDVKVGKTVFINGVRITLNKIVQDSRCPIDVMCIHAGWVTASVTLQSDTDKETRDISSNEGPVGFDSYKISIDNVKPSPVAGSRITPESYVITFRVREN